MFFEEAEICLADVSIPERIVDRLMSKNIVPLWGKISHCAFLIFRAQIFKGNFKTAGKMSGLVAVSEIAYSRDTWEGGCWRMA